MVFDHTEFEASFPHALKNCSYVFDQLLKGIDGYVNIVDILCTLIGFDYSIKVFANETRCANLLYANVLLANLNAKSSIDCWLAI